MIDEATPMNEEGPSSESFLRWLWPVIGVVVCVGLGSLVALTMEKGGGEWYQGLIKPPGNPPSWLFAPVWGVLYLMMGIVIGRLVYLRAQGAVRLFIIQFILNLAWTPVFFGAHAMGWALVIMFGIWFFLAMTIRSAERVDHLSAMLLLPYLLWIMYAAYLNASIAWLNRG